jgi:hypothetical protein
MCKYEHPLIDETYLALAALTEYAIPSLRDRLADKKCTAHVEKFEMLKGGP